MNSWAKNVFYISFEQVSIQLTWYMPYYTTPQSLLAVFQCRYIVMHGITQQEIGKPILF